MKKFVLLALLFIPVTTFAASSVRVLGAKTSTSGTAVSSNTPAAKVLPTKAATTGNTGAARTGTVRAVPKATTGTVSASTATTANSTARFPVISPARPYSSVAKPQVTGGGVASADLSNYYTKQETYNQNEIDNMLEDPRVDMIHTGANKEAYWRGKKGDQEINDLMRDGYVFMWVETED